MRSSDFHEKNKVHTMVVIVPCVCADFQSDARTSAVLLCCGSGHWRSVLQPLSFLMFTSWAVMEQITNPGRFLLSSFYGPMDEGRHFCLIRLSPLLLSLSL